MGFSCKKHGEASTSISVQANLSVVDRIRQIYGGAVAQELVEFSSSDSRWGFKAQGWATNANYSVKKTTLLLFINHRCVESGNIRKAIEQTYASFLPKNGHPFVYLSLEVDPQRVDVNVHPTKKEVNFMNEDEIIQAICEDIRSRLASVDTSRTFMTQTLLPGVLSSASGSDTPEKGPQSTRKMIGKTPVRIYENNLVRTDASMRKITSMLPTVAGPSTSKSEPRPYEIDYETTDREPMPCRLSSVHKLRAEVRDDMHKELTEMFASHAFVGIVDEQRRLAAIQGGIKLYLIDYGRVCFEYFYQVGLTDFNNFGTIRFGPPLDLREVIKIAAEHERDVLTRDGGAADFSVADIAEKVASQLIERREMLQEYFSMEITPAGELRSIPLLIKGYTPSMAKLPQFLLRLGPHVDWTNEIGCFRSLVREIASFYVPEPLPPAQEEGEVAGDGVISNEVKQRRDAVRWAVEHVLFPAFKSRLVATNGLMKDGILELTNLKSLYRVFERC